MYPREHMKAVNLLFASSSSSKLIEGIFFSTPVKFHLLKLHTLKIIKTLTWYWDGLFMVQMNQLQTELRLARSLIAERESELQRVRTTNNQVTQIQSSLDSYVVS